MTLRSIISLTGLAAATALVVCAPARAASPSIIAACTAPAPAEGVSFSGPVLQVIDGGRLCVATGPTPDQWVAVQPVGLVRAAARRAASDRSLLMTAAFSKRLSCIAGRSHDGAVEATCTVEGAPLSAAVAAAQHEPDWRLWR